MSHARQQIREAAATLLAGILPTIYTSRVYPALNLPNISVYANRETVETELDHGPGSQKRYSRLLELEITITAEAVTGVDDLIDDYAAQVEAALAGDITLGGLCEDSRLMGSSFDLDGEAEKPLGLLRIIYEIWYRTTSADAETPL